MKSLGVGNLPSVAQLKDSNVRMQGYCGVKSIRYEGQLGHLYYANSIADIVSQVWFIIFRTTFYNSLV